MKIRIVFFSGVGNTLYLTEMLRNSLESAGHEVIATRVEDFNPALMSSCDCAGFGGPVYHTSAPAPLVEALERCTVNSMPLFTFWTMGLYAADCARNFQDRAVARGFRPVANLEALFPGTDMAMLLPSGHWMHRFHMRIDKKLEEKISRLVKAMDGAPEEKMAGRRWYTPLDTLAQKAARPAYRVYKERLTVDPDLCTRCDRCKRDCPTGSLYRDDQGGYRFRPDTCILCLRCYHHCPSGAVGLSGRVEDLNHCYDRYRGPKGLPGSQQ